MALSPSLDVIVNDPEATVYDHRPAAGVVPVTRTMGTEFAENLSSVMTQVFGVEPHKTVAGVLYRAQPS